MTRRCQCHLTGDTPQNVPARFQVSKGDGLLEDKPPIGGSIGWGSRTL